MDHGVEVGGTKLACMSLSALPSLCLSVFLSGYVRVSPLLELDVRLASWRAGWPSSGMCVDPSGLRSTADAHIRCTSES